MEDLKKVLKEKEEMTDQEAETEIQEARQEFQELLAEGDLDEAYHLCETRWGLEPDYIEQLTPL